MPVEANCFLNLCLAESGEEKDTLQLGQRLGAQNLGLIRGWGRDGVRNNLTSELPVPWSYLFFLKSYIDYLSVLTCLLSNLLKYFKWLPIAYRTKFRLLSGVHWYPAPPDFITYTELFLFSEHALPFTCLLALV